MSFHWLQGAQQRAAVKKTWADLTSCPPIHYPSHRIYHSLSYPLASPPSSSAPLALSLQAIITLSDSLVSTLDVAFTSGGSPLIIQTEGEDFIADFVIATTDFDPEGTPSGAGTGSRVKKEQSEQASGVGGRRGSSLARADSRGGSGSGSTTTGAGSAASRNTGGAAGSNANAKAGPSRLRQEPPPPRAKPAQQPLFNPPSPSQNRAQAEEEDEYDEFGDSAMADFDEGAFAEIDRMSQMAPQGAGGGSQVPRERERGQTLVPDTSVDHGASGGEGLAERAASMGLGPTQNGGEELVENELEGRRKKVRFLSSSETEARRSLTFLDRSLAGQVESARLGAKDGDCRALIDVAVC